MFSNTDVQTDEIKILIIEDEELLREYVSDHLEDNDYEVLQAANGREGIDVLRDKRPDLVLTDLRMPEVNGLDVLAVISKEYPEIPVIVISGTGSLNDVVQSHKLGAWDYILKPIHDYSVLDMAIERVLERKRLVEENRRYKEHLEAEVQKRTNELMRSTLRFKSLFDLAGDAIFIHSLEGKMIEFNQMAIDTLGYTREELCALSMQDLFPLDQKTLFAESLKLLTDKKSTIFESTHICKDGSLIPVEVHICLIQMDSIVQVMAICRNISERKAAEKEKAEMQQTIVSAQKMEMVGMLAGGIAHDFNNILCALNGYVFILSEKLKSDPNEYALLEKIAEIVTIGQQQTSRITNFIRKKPQEFTIVNIHKVLKETEALLVPSCKGVAINLALNADTDTVLGDEGQLVNAFLNLGLNARDAMPKGGKLTFATSVLKSGSPRCTCDAIFIEVSDTGTGIDEEIQKKVFEPLFTTKEQGKGTGLGLTGVAYSLKNHNGTISVNSIPGAGTTFEIVLPLVKERKIRSVANKTNHSVLIVSHRNDAAERLNDLFGSNQIDSVVFNDYPSAREHLNSFCESVGLVLIDYYMPLIREADIRSEIECFCQKVPFIYISGKDYMSLRALKESYLYNGFANTPMDSDQFIDMVYTVLRECQ